MYIYIYKLKQKLVHDTQSAQHAQSKEHNTYSDVMKTVQCGHPTHQHIDFVMTCQLWTDCGGVPAF